MTKTAPSSHARQLPRRSQVDGAAPVTVTGVLADGTGAVTGTFLHSDTVDSRTGLSAIGTFTGSVTNASGSVTTGTQGLELPVHDADGTGRLSPGPLHLVLLGWDVRVTVSQPGDGTTEAVPTM